MNIRETEIIIRFLTAPTIKSFKPGNVRTEEPKRKEPVIAAFPIQNRSITAHPRQRIQKASNNLLLRDPSTFLKNSPARMLRHTALFQFRAVPKEGRTTNPESERKLKS